MKLSTPISKHLRDHKTWQEADEHMKQSFRDHMKGKAYGFEACLNAWLWFRDGMIAGVRRATP